MSPKLFATLTRRKPGQRGPQKAPTKEMITLRLDREVLAACRVTGPGWQSRMNDTLKAALRAKRRAEAKAAMRANAKAAAPALARAARKKVASSRTKVES
jgi:hypothetical protein